MLTWLDSIFHSGAPKYVSVLYPKLGDTITLQLRAAADAPIKRVWLRYFPDGEQQFAPMTAAQASDAVQWWTIDFAIKQPVEHYRFVIEAEDGIYWYTAKGIQIQEPLDAFDFRIVADYHGPSWLLSTVFYQIFPDRFANGDPHNDPQPQDYEHAGQRPETFAWGADPDPDKIFPLVFYGGDLQGVAQRLDYLAQLGINGIYLNPIFTADSNHKYDVADYDNVDVHFGGNEALIALREALSRRNMRYMMDIVPNHCGYSHTWFQAALADQHAPEADYFTFHNHPTSYESWLGVWTLPKLNYESEALREAMYRSAESVMNKWLLPPFSADGWRVDVANMLGRQGEIQIGTVVTREMRQSIKASAPDSFLLGENFFDATAQMQGDQYDSIMNYMGFTKPLLYWLCGYRLGAWGMRESIRSAGPYRTESMLATMAERLSVVPWQLALQQFNLLGSHDTSRIRTLVGGNDALHKLAVTVLLTYPGVPSIYYGDEIGMQDHPKLDQRGCMVWDESQWNTDLLAHYRTLIGLRRSEPALQSGSLQIVGHGADWFAYLREGEAGSVLVIANRGSAIDDFVLDLSRTDVADGTLFVDGFSAETITCNARRLHLLSLPQGARLLLNR